MPQRGSQSTVQGSMKMFSYHFGDFQHSFRFAWWPVGKSSFFSWWNTLILDWIHRCTWQLLKYRNHTFAERNRRYWCIEQFYAFTTDTGMLYLTWQGPKSSPWNRGRDYTLWGKASLFSLEHGKLSGLSTAINRTMRTLNNFNSLGPTRH
jgi:hypothetical protein